MRHLKKGRKFGRERNQRRALIKGLATSFFMRGKIRTTEAKARELQPIVEKFLTVGKDAALASRRALGSRFSPSATTKIFEMSRHFQDRSGGYTRIIKIPGRRRDSAKMAILEIVK